MSISLQWYFLNFSPLLVNHFFEEDQELKRRVIVDIGSGNTKLIVVDVYKIAGIATEVFRNAKTFCMQYIIMIYTEML